MHTLIRPQKNWPSYSPSQLETKTINLSKLKTAQKGRLSEKLVRASYSASLYYNAPTQISASVYPLFPAPLPHLFLFILSSKNLSCGFYYTKKYFFSQISQQSEKIKTISRSLSVSFLSLSHYTKMKAFYLVSVFFTVTVTLAQIPHTPFKSEF